MAQNTLFHEDQAHYFMESKPDNRTGSYNTKTTERATSHTTLTLKGFVQSGQLFLTHTTLTFKGFVQSGKLFLTHTQHSCSKGLCSQDNCLQLTHNTDAQRVCAIRTVVFNSHTTLTFKGFVQSGQLSTTHIRSVTFFHIMLMLKGFVQSTELLETHEQGAYSQQNYCL